MHIPVVTQTQSEARVILVPAVDINNNTCHTQQTRKVKNSCNIVIEIVYLSSAYWHYITKKLYNELVIKGATCTFFYCFSNKVQDVFFYYIKGGGTRFGDRGLPKSPTRRRVFW